jgi:hypothetical protein
MWSKVTKYHDYDTARKAWGSVRAIPHAHYTVTNVQYEGIQYLVIISDEKPTTEVLTQIAEVVKGGTSASLPVKILRSLMERRLQRATEAIATEGERVSFENHTPTVINTEIDTESWLDGLDSVLDDMIDSAYLVMRRGLLEDYKPFINAYKRLKEIEVEMAVMSSEPEEYIQKLKAYHDMKTLLDKAPHYMFTESARAMNETVQDDKLLLEYAQGYTYWIEHDIAQELPTGTKVKAFYIIDTTAFNLPSVPATSLIACIDDMLDSYMALEYYHTDNTWSLPRSCNYDTCSYATIEELIEHDMLHLVQEEDRLFPARDSATDKMLVMCRRCRMELDYTIAFLRTALKQIHMDYATSSTPTDFAVQHMTYTEKRLTERRHGKGKPKEKTFTVDVPYTYVSYDLGTSAQPRPQTAADSMPRAAMINWHNLHSKDEIIYERRSIADTVRRYTLPYFKTLIERVQQHCSPGHTYIENEEEYTLLTQADGTPVVIGRVRFPTGKYIPMLRPEYRKKNVIKRLTAASFEEGTN